MKIRWLSFKNVARDAWAKNPFLACVLALGGVILFTGVLGGFLIFLKFAGTGEALQESIFSVFYFLLLFLLAGAVPFVASTLLQSADYGLLFNAPVPPRTVIAAKLLDATVTNSLQFLVLGIPAMVATAIVLQLPLIGWLLLPLLVAFFALLPALLTALALLILLSTIGIARLRGILIILNGIMALIVCITIVFETNHIPRFREFGRYLMSNSAPPLKASPAAHFAPSAWFAEVLLDLSHGKMGMALLRLGVIALLCVVLYAICMEMGAKLLTAGNVAEDTSSGTIAAGGHEANNPFSGKPIFALVRKDFRYLKRDAMLLSQLVMPILLYFVPFLLSRTSPDLKPQDELFPLTMTMVGTILFMQTSILSLSSIGLEGRSFWISLVSPNSTLRILQAKWLMSTLFTTSVSLTLTVIACFVFSTPFVLSVASLGVVVLACAALCGLGVGISASFPRFVYENPAHRVSFWALTLGFFTTLGYLFMTGILFVGAWYLSLRTQSPGETRILWATTFVFYSGVSFLSVIFPLAVGARRLSNYPWEH